MSIESLLHEAGYRLAKNDVYTQVYMKDTEDRGYIVEVDTVPLPTRYNEFQFRVRYHNTTVAFGNEDLVTTLLEAYLKAKEVK